jgi:hypothetical protein
MELDSDANTTKIDKASFFIKFISYVQSVFQLLEAPSLFVVGLYVSWFADAFLIATSDRHSIVDLGAILPDPCGSERAPELFDICIDYFCG